MSAPDPLSWTLRFKKYKTTVLLMVAPHESIESTKEKLLHALKSRGIKDINGDEVPDDSSDIELGVPVDRNGLEKGWTQLDVEATQLTNGTNKKKAAGRGKNGTKTNLQSADIRDGQSIAFRFRKAGDEKQDGDDLDLDLEDPRWDVVVPTLDDEEPDE